eukprot:CAMPEP_0198286668 /NCGR_PEP_ID=MMETSP1449-20131203/5684_1 /TAXON_ID=420275 /ORGANISM="Attheya septentrionalis, Strain CCMP2084" /LENGTH=375 /DNA_ID=CAMNT_0043984453 /DNA_START=327 /DNA_END=1454 /DNA_ORIENTATION=+
MCASAMPATNNHDDDVGGHYSQQHYLDNDQDIRDEWMDPWGDALEPLDDNPALDRSTRFLIELLDELDMGVRLHKDRATTARCNRALEQLLMEEKDLKGRKARTKRADAILRRMETFLFSTRNDNEVLKYPLPYPNSRSYQLVLRLYADTIGLKRNAQRAHELVTHMEESGLLELKPTIVEWNDVLSAWAISTDSDKAYHAAKLLDQLSGGGEHENNGVVDRRYAMADASSYGHVLRACAFSDATQNWTQRSQKLGAEIAVRTWEQFFSTTLKPTSYMYSFYLQACLYIPNATRRDKLVKDAFQDCCDRGLVNIHILRNLEKSTSPDLYQSLLAPYIDTKLTTNVKVNVNDKARLEQLPGEWTRYATKTKKQQII